MSTLLIKGDKINLKPSSPEDKINIYHWLAHSDLSSSMFGPPLFPETLAPTWEEFLDDYKEYYFDGTQPNLGRCFLILWEETPIGQINYNEISKDEHSTELDIWLSSSQYIGKGYGSDAIETLCEYLKSSLMVKKVIIAPSARNVAAIKAYKKAGFIETTEIPDDFIPDYNDTVVLVKYLD